MFDPPYERPEPPPDMSGFTMETIREGAPLARRPIVIPVPVMLCLLAVLMVAVITVWVALP